MVDMHHMTSASAQVPRSCWKQTRSCNGTVIRERDAELRVTSDTCPQQVHLFCHALALLS